MAYDLQLVELNEMVASNTSWGFPANTPFTTFLMSYWMCGPYRSADGVNASPSFWPSFQQTPFVGFGPGVNISIAGHPFIAMSNMDQASNAAFYTGNIPNPQPTAPSGCLLHFMMSVDTAAQKVQVYINDQPVTITSPTWIGTPPYYFKVRNIVNIWDWLQGPFSGTPTRLGAIGDAWMTNPPAFVDLSLTANRRKFISSQMLPVDLGNTGTAPFGYQPALYMSVRPGGVAADILTNRGIGGGTWATTGGFVPVFQTAGACVAIPVPPPAPMSALALDDVTCSTIPLLPSNQVFLEWSDDRGHSYGNPVGQSMGEQGEYLTSCQWQRLGMGRDRVFRIFWSTPTATALQGAWIDATPATS